MGNCMYRCNDGETDILQQSVDNQLSNMSSVHSNYGSSTFGQPATATTPTTPTTATTRTSIAQSVASNGDRSVYPIHNNEDEINRLQLMHYMVRYGWEGNFSSPIHNVLKAGKAKVLDIGCGPGTWILEMAADYPHSTFIGLDNSPIFPSAIKPHNARFYEADVHNGLPFENDTFDLVHQRFLALALKEVEWMPLIDEIVRVTKPGGYCEIMDCDFAIDKQGPVTQTLIEAVRTCIQANGINPYMHEKIKELLSDTNMLDDITAKEKVTPFGSWGGRWGELVSDGLRMSANSFKPIIQPTLGLSDEEYVKAVNHSVTQEMNEYRSETKMYRLYGKKKTCNSTEE